MKKTQTIRDRRFDRQNKLLCRVCQARQSMIGSEADPHRRQILREKNKRTQDTLIARNEGLVRAITSNILERYGLTQDIELFDALLQVGRICLWKSITRFQESDNPSVKFSSYAWVIIAREVNRAIKERFTRGRSVKPRLSLDAEVDTGEEKVSRYELLADTNAKEPSDILIEQEEAERLWGKINALPEPLRVTVMTRYETGSIAETSRKLHQQYHTVYRRLEEARRILGA